MTRLSLFLLCSSVLLPLTSVACEETSCTEIGVRQGLFVDVNAGELVNEPYILEIDASGDSNAEDFKSTYACVLPTEANGTSDCTSLDNETSYRTALISIQKKNVHIDLEFPDDFPSQIDVKLFSIMKDLIGSTVVENIEYQVQQPNGAECDGNDQLAANLTATLESP